MRIKVTRIDWTNNTLRVDDEGTYYDGSFSIVDGQLVFEWEYDFNVTDPHELQYLAFIVSQGAMLDAGYKSPTRTKWPDGSKRFYLCFYGEAYTYYVCWYNVKKKRWIFHNDGTAFSDDLITHYLPLPHGSKLILDYGRFKF